MKGKIKTIIKLVGFSYLLFTSGTAVGQSVDLVTKNTDSAEPLSIPNTLLSEPIIEVEIPVFPSEPCTRISAPPTLVTFDPVPLTGDDADNHDGTSS